MRTTLAMLAALCLAVTTQAQPPKAADNSNPQTYRTSETAPRSSADVEALREYHSRVGEAVRQTEARLQEISAQVGAGEITAEKGRELKLEATRTMLARMETLLAIYDARVSASARGATVSVKELQGIGTAASAAK